MRFAVTSVSFALLLGSVLADDCKCKFAGRFMYGETRIRNGSILLGSGRWYADVVSNYFKATSSFKTPSVTDTWYYYRDSSNYVACFQKQNTCRKNIDLLWVDKCVPGGATLRSNVTWKKDGRTRTTYLYGDRNGPFLALYTVIHLSNQTCQPTYFREQANGLIYFYDFEGYDQARDAAFYQKEIKSFTNLETDDNLG